MNGEVENNSRSWIVDNGRSKTENDLCLASTSFSTLKHSEKRELEKYSQTTSV